MRYIRTEQRKKSNEQLQAKLNDVIELWCDSESYEKFRIEAELQHGKLPLRWKCAFWLWLMTKEHPIKLWLSLGLTVAASTYISLWHIVYPNQHMSTAVFTGVCAIVSAMAMAVVFIALHIVYDDIWIKIAVAERMQNDSL